MPMIDLTLSPGALDDNTRDALVQDLLRTLLKWEGAPDNERSKSLAWAFVHPAGITVASSPSGGHHYRVGVTTPEGALDERRRAGLIADVTELVLAADGSPNTVDDAFRVWVQVHEIKEGSWGAAGAIWRFEDVIDYVTEQRDAKEICRRSVERAAVATAALV